MSNIIRVSLAVVMMLVGTVCADATTPLRETLDHKNISADFASINTWKPELPLIHPISNGDADEAPDGRSPLVELLHSRGEVEEQLRARQSFRWRGRR